MVLNAYLVGFVCVWGGGGGRRGVFLCFSGFFFLRIHINNIEAYV